jgi:hypothetical protein
VPRATSARGPDCCAAWASAASPLLSQRWQALQRVMLSPGKIGDIARAALVLVQFEHKMIT